MKSKKTCAADFEKIYPLLQEFDSPHSLEDWKRIFLYQWDGTRDFIGFHLEHHGNVVGFMGLIFSCRYHNNRQYQFCNITSLIVKKNYRPATVLLIRKLKTIENTIFTGLCPIAASYQLFTLLGFASYEQFVVLIPTVNRWLGLTSKIKMSEQPFLCDQLDEENKRIIKDHENLACHTMLFTLNDNHCLVIYKIIQQKYCKISIKKIILLYISNLTMFNNHIHTILKFFNQKFGLFSIVYADSRFINKSKILFTTRKTINPPRIYSSPYSETIEIDKLYSESVLL